MMLTFYHIVAITSASQKRLQLQQRLTARHRRVRYTHRAAKRPIKHPLGNL
jgi:hypothetical protein